MCPALSLFPSLAFQSTTPSSLSLLSLLSGWFVNSLSVWLSLLLLIVSLPPRKANALQEFLFFFSKGRLLCTNTVQTRLPSVLSPFETPCSLNTIRLKRMPSAFLLHSHSSALTHSLTFPHTHTNTLGLCGNTITRAHAPTFAHTGSHQNTHACIHAYIEFQQCHWYIESVFLSHFELILPHLISLSLWLHLYAWPYSSYWPFSRKGLIQVKQLTCIFFTFQPSFPVVALDKAVNRSAHSNYK